jgi:hypothetical protein
MRRSNGLPKNSVSGKWLTSLSDWVCASSQSHQKTKKELEIVLLKPDAAVHGKELAQVLTKRIGKGTTWVLEVDDCQKVYKEFQSRGVEFTDPAKQRPYGSGGTFRRSLWEPVGPNTADIGIIT